VSCYARRPGPVVGLRLDDDRISSIARNRILAHMTLLPWRKVSSRATTAFEGANNPNLSIPPLIRLRIYWASFKVIFV
jgi:hypothetical protein